MPKEFYTERDIEDLVKRGVMSLEINDNVVLTELAYEKANRLGFKLIRSAPDTPPAAPIRPYLSQKQFPTTTAPTPAPAPPKETDLHERIRSAVLARMGNQLDPALLDAIIQRVLRSTGVK